MKLEMHIEFSRDHSNFDSGRNPEIGLACFRDEDKDPPFAWIYSKNNGFALAKKEECHKFEKAISIFGSEKNAVKALEEAMPLRFYDDAKSIFKKNTQYTFLKEIEYFFIYEFGYLVEVDINL